MLERDTAAVAGPMSEAIETFLASHGRRQVLSVAATLKAVRRMVPGCGLRDDELAHLIARCAMSRGIGVLNFDLNAKRSMIERAVE